SDGHADIVDPIDGVIHSFLNLKKGQDGRWTASMYAWTRLDGRGWGDPSHYYQGARAAAVPPMAGLVRKHEVNDGQPMYRHALAMSLAHNGLSSKRGYVFPATSADRTWKENTGGIPEGALLMLPEAFDTNLIDDPGLRKIAETLKVYGAYVVDRNHGTPFYIYVENGSKFAFQKPKWDAAVTKDLKRIQKALRQVVSVQGWIDGHGKEFDAVEHFNMLSMRGPWVKAEGSGEARYDTWTQSMVITGASAGSEFQHRNNRSFSAVDWARMKAGKSYTLQFKASEGIQMELKIFGTKGKRMLFNSHWLNNGDSVKFTWPGEQTRTVITVRKTASDGKESRARALVYPDNDLLRNPLINAVSTLN
ncbi:Atrophin-1 multi-domain protein, partial [Limnobacter sp.]|uniref:Atrophin-1 multi-domain protein n=1 Tax=Limnobacter sp. TaxID=2003368 RepID=UPI0027332BFC